MKGRLGPHLLRQECVRRHNWKYQTLLSITRFYHSLFLYLSADLTSAQRSVERQNVRPCRKCAHLRTASLIAAASRSIVGYFFSVGESVRDIKATGQPFWLRVAAIAISDASHSTRISWLLTRFTKQARSEPCFKSSNASISLPKEKRYLETKRSCRLKT